MGSALSHLVLMVVVLNLQDLGAMASCNVILHGLPFELSGFQKHFDFGIGHERSILTFDVIKIQSDCRTVGVLPYVFEGLVKDLVPVILIGG